MSKYKIIYKKHGILHHEHIEAKNIDNLSFLIRYREGIDAVLVKVEKII